MQENIPAKSINKANVNIARVAVNKLRDDDYDALKPAARAAIENIVGELSVCTDISMLVDVAYKKFGFINKEFVPLEYGVAAKFRAIDMLNAYTTSIYTQLGVIKKSVPKL